MKKILLLIFLSFALHGYAESPSFNASGDGIATSMGEEEFINITSTVTDNVRFSYNFKTAKTLKIYNLLGKCVVSVKLAGGINNIDLPTSLERGTYIYSVEDGSKKFGAKKFIVR
ncbi:T9SS type A sorting domain-containing protein [Dysgonomonas sp. 520]|uniref:T9SS type A sorting domain-containing protein n=1 Tax=Dysgonomonas sp. 520 TaxID=2302931 RepID=UPI0013D2ABD9|nr:T9SS type A sorting domain-containing protein [Dysgonomonas sp. 520]NDW08081.1 T9SS C-terminal target domain-containing protein [Dysgonomonas sp. 520]